MLWLTSLTTLAISTLIVGSQQGTDAAFVPFKVLEKFLGNNEVLDPVAEDTSLSHQSGFKSHQLAHPDGLDGDESWPEFQCNADFGSFQCTSGQCILAAFRCDSNVDCDDGSDENGCESAHQNQQTTDDVGNLDISGEIVLPDWIKPKQNHFALWSTPAPQQHLESSLYGSDITHPPHSTTSSSYCLDSELFFTCTATGRCIFAEFRCDGDADCADASDERGCPTENAVTHNAVSGITTGNPSALTAYRLSDIQGEGNGRLEVYHDGQWGTVCDDSFSDIDAKVACVSLGYRLGIVKRINIRRKSDQVGPIWLDDVQCSGTESSLEECSHPGWGQHNCHHLEDVYIGCSHPTEDTLTISPAKETQTSKPDLDDYDTENEDVSESGSGSGSGGSGGSGYADD